MKYTVSALFSMFLLLSFVSHAQKNLTQGVIKMEITEVNADDPAMAGQIGMLKGSTQAIYFNADKTLSVMNMMGGMMETTTLMDLNSKTGFMLFNIEMLGQKIKVDLTEDMTNEAEKSNMQVEYFPEDKKVIQGYNCHRAEISSPDMGEGKFIVYVTDQIVAKSSPIQGVEEGLLKGFPLEYVMEAPGFSMVYRAVEILDKVDTSVFNVSTAGYETQTMEEFQKSMGAFGGMGF